VLARPPLRHHLAWQVPSLLWLVEVAVVTAVAVRGLTGSEGLAYAWLAAVAYHRYDVIYRLRDTSEAPAQWLTALGLGVEGRILLVLAVAAFAPDALGPVLAVGAVYLALVYGAESALGWLRWSREEETFEDSSALGAEA
jgi:predicted DNA repair protein MutK